MSKLFVKETLKFIMDFLSYAEPHCRFLTDNSWDRIGLLLLFLISLANYKYRQVVIVIYSIDRKDKIRLKCVVIRLSNIKFTCNLY